MESWDRVTSFGSDHHAVIDVATAHELSVPLSSLVTWHRQGRLQHPAPQVYVVAGSPSTWRQRVMIAAFSTKGWASHLTAAALWGLDGCDPRQIEVLRLHGQARSRAGWTVRETRRFNGVDIAEVDGIPCTAVPRTILDLAATAHPFVVAQALDHACRKWPGMLQVITTRFLELAGRGRKGTVLMRSMLDERLGRGTFTQSGFEANTLKLARQIGLPDPVPQFHVTDGQFSAYLDLAWPAIKWGVECDSLAYHSGKRAHEWDRMRRRKLKQLGWDLVEITYDDVTKRRAHTGAQLSDLYRARERSVLAALRT